MTDRDRLIEILDSVQCKANCCIAVNKKCADLDNLDRCQIQAIADYLIANGVIVPPVDIGKTVYKVSRLGKIVSLNVANYDYGVITFPYNIIPFENFGKTVFLTKEEAEAKLKECEGK